MKAAVLNPYKHFQWQEVPDPIAGDTEVLIKVEYAGICGSDLHIFNGDFHPRTNLPMIPGHEFCGIIKKTGKKIKKFKPGDLVTVDPIIWCGTCAACQKEHYPACTSLKLIGVDRDGGFGELVAVKEDMLFKIPDTVSAKHAGLVELYSIGFHACKRAELKINDSVVIWGTGRIGHSILQAARTITRNTIVCIDIFDSRLAVARKAYPDIITINALETDPVQAIKELTQGRGTDVAFEAVGHARSIPNVSNPVRGCVQSIRGAGTVCVLGLGDEPSAVVMKELIWKEARIVASRVSHGEFADAIYHLEKGLLKPDAIISSELPASEAQKAFEFLENEPDKYLKILFKFR